MWVDRLTAAAPALWAVMALAFAAARSFWGDEWNHVQDILNHGVMGAALELLKKPSPFHPGEALLNGFFWKTLGLFNVPAEVWARAQGILWGTLTVALGARLARQEPRRLRVLPWLLFFSAALLSYAAEMRPYASLFYSGALCATVLWEQRLANGLPRLGAWLLIFSGHLYGICFLVVCLLWVGRGRRHWPEVLIGVTVVFGVLTSIHITAEQGIAPWDGVFQISRQILGTWANPHRVTLLYGPLAAWGGWVGWRSTELRRKTLLIMLFMMGAALLPLAATLYSKYFFVPRQMAAGTAPFLLLCALGAQSLRRKTVIVALLICAAGSWSAVYLLKRPPFVSQPFHRFKEVAQDIAQSKTSDVLLLDVCNRGPIEDYFSRHFKIAGYIDQASLGGGLSFDKKCWFKSWPGEETVCVTFLMDYSFCTKPAEMLAVDQPLGRALRSREFQKVIHGYQQDPVRYAPEYAGRFVRDW